MFVIQEPILESTNIKENISKMFPNKEKIKILKYRNLHPIIQKIEAKSYKNEKGNISKPFPRKKK
jgi:hypothetical protein